MVNERMDVKPKNQPMQSHKPAMPERTLKHARF